MYSLMVSGATGVLRRGTISTGGYRVVAELGKKIAEIHAEVEPFREERGTGN